jgi:hypothetical protein
MVALAGAVAFFAALNVQAYFDPSTGRWAGRDPLGEPGFENLRAASMVPRVGQVISPASLPPGRWGNRDSAAAKATPNRYAMVGNNPIDQIDILGLLNTGGIAIVANGPNGSDGWNVRFEWTPPKDICCRCTKAVWVQNKDDTAETLLFTYHSSGVDWDESSYMGGGWGPWKTDQQSDLWTCGGNFKNMDMWDTPGPTPWSQISLILWRNFKATSQVKCIDGPEKGSIYGTVNWWFYWQRNPYTLNGGATSSFGPIAGY